MIFLVLIFYFIVMFAISGIVYLRANKDEGFYANVFNWWISPFVIIAGLVFIDKGNKKQYFQRVKSNLLIKK